MAYFLVDGDLTGFGTFVEAEVTLSVEYTVPAGTVGKTRARWATAPVPSNAPAIRIYDAGGTVVSTWTFDTTSVDAWNEATLTSGTAALAAGTYQVSWNTTRYPAVGSFFAAGPITRGDVTAVRGRFVSGIANPTNPSTALYPVDFDFTASSELPVTSAPSPAIVTASLAGDLATLTASARDLATRTISRDLEV